jgi:hypothetical protein
MGKGRRWKQGGIDANEERLTQDRRGRKREEDGGCGERESESEMIMTVMVVMKCVFICVNFNSYVISPFLLFVCLLPSSELLGYNIHPPFIGYVDGRHPKRLLHTQES